MTKLDGVAESRIRANARGLLEAIGEDPDREGLKDTPSRVAESYQTIFGGYGIDPKSVLTVFEEDTSDQMIVCKSIEMYSTCEHHMLPFYGVAHIAYLPNKKIVGLSKLARVVEIFSRRLQVQERLTNQITEALNACLFPKGVGCVIEARHLCMMCRGVQKQNSSMITSSLKGVFLEDTVKQEFMRLVGF